MEGQTKIHLHVALARKDELLMGCLRGKSEVFLVSEIVLFELLEIEALREKDEELDCPSLNLAKYL